jgi:polyhydroxyalkanoate synthesis regulator phasin
MAQTPLQRALAELADVRELTQQRAERLVRDLVRSGEVQAEQAQAFANDLVERSRRNRERLVKEIEKSVREQVSRLRVANQADIARLEKRLASLEAAQKRAGKAAKKSPAKKSPAKKAASSYAPRRGSADAADDA